MTMRVKAMKTGTFANYDTTKPPYKTIEMQIMDVDDLTAIEMISVGWAVAYNGGPVAMPDGENID